MVSVLTSQNIDNFWYSNRHMSKMLKLSHQTNNLEIASAVYDKIRYISSSHLRLVSLFIWKYKRKGKGKGNVDLYSACAQSWNL